MLFNTLQFAWFFVVVFGVSWALLRTRTLRLIFLFAASYYFYAGWNWKYLPLILISSTVDYLLGNIIAREEDPNKRKRWLIGTVVVNLGFLGLFKYWNFAIDSVQSLWLVELALQRHDFAWLAAHWSWEPNGLQTLASLLQVQIPEAYLKLALPVGISFYTFESMSYVIDVYRRTTKPCDSYLKYLLFVAFFPKLVAGPIIRPRDLIPQFERDPRWNSLEAGKALFLIAIGLVKKVAIGDYLAVNLVDRVFERPANYSGLEALTAVYGYAVQIYCDFSGYSDIAIGCAALLGVNFSLNFNSPYKAHNLQDFWRRWHISLSSWLRDYLYIPLGGSQGSTLRTYRNLLLTMLLGGLWHGAAWNFVFWGFLHGSLLAVTRMVQRSVGQWLPQQGIGAWALKLVGVLFTFHYVCLAWIFFRAESFPKAWAMLTRIASGTWFHPNLHTWVLFALGLGLVSHYTPDKVYKWIRDAFAQSPFYVQGIVLFLVFWLLREVASAQAVPFLYFQF